MNDIGARDAELFWYTASATHRIFLYSLKQRVGIHSFKSTWLCLTVEVLATRAHISSVLCLLFYDQLHNDLLYNECFWVLLKRYGPVRFGLVWFGFMAYQPLLVI